MRFRRQEGIFSVQETTALKGLFALLIVLHHVGIVVNIQEHFWARVNGNLGGIGVGAFFLFSAFGSIRQYQKDSKKYPLRMLLVKTPILYAYQVATNFLYFLVEKPTGAPWQIALRIFNLDVFFGLERMNPYSWFITTILFVYIVMVGVLALANLFKEKDRRLFIATVTSVLSLAAYIPITIWGDDLYVRSLPCYAIGVLYTLYYEEINHWFKKKWAFWGSTAFLLTALTVALVLMGTLRVEAELIFSIIIVLLILTLAQRLTIRNKWLELIGKISLEIYLLHFLALRRLAENTTDGVFLFVAVVGASIVMAYLYRFGYQNTLKLGRMLTNKSKQKRME